MQQLLILLLQGSPHFDSSPQALRLTRNGQLVGGTMDLLRQLKGTQQPLFPLQQSHSAQCTNRILALD